MFNNVLKRIRAHTKAKTTDCGADSTYRSSAVYTSQDKFDAEASRLFKKRPVIAGRTAEVASPGDFITRDILGVSFIIVMGEDKKRRAFLNSCRHRGTQLVDAKSGTNCKHFTCPYHAWTYDVKGKLTGQPHGEEGFPTIPRADLGLIEIECFSEFGFLFVTLDPDSATDADFSGIREELEFYGIENYHSFHSRTDTVNANWKAAIENFLEGYHIHSVHATTVGRKTVDHLTLYDQFGDHARVVFPLRSVLDAGAAPGPRELTKHLSVLYFIYPSTVLLVVEGRYVLSETFVPVSVDKTNVVRHLLIPKAPASPRETDDWRRVAAFFDVFVSEDFQVVERVQKGLTAVTPRDIVFGRFEHGIVELHRRIERDIADQATKPFRIAG